VGKDSEFRAYSYIERVLGELGWNTRNPARGNGGQVYTQGEFRKHDDILTKALGHKTPENIIVIPWDRGPRYWVVESKREHSDLKKAISEAKIYATKINKIKFSEGGGVTLLDSQQVLLEPLTNHSMSKPPTGTVINGMMSPSTITKQPDF